MQASNSCIQGRIKGGATGAIAPGPLLQGAPRDDIYLFWIKNSFEKLSWFKRDTKIQLYIPMLPWVSSMILCKFDFLPALVILTEYKYFRFRSMQIYLKFACNFS